MPIAISPFHYSHDFPGGLSLEQKIEIFNVRVRVWQLDPAHRLANIVEHSGFAVLHIIMSYFESLAKFRDGFCETGCSKKYFKEGFEWVFPRPERIPKEKYDALLTKLYKSVRSGLYHAATTGKGVILTGEIDAPVAVGQNDQGEDLIVINPHKIVPSLREHLFDYLRALRDPTKDDLRRKFESRFDWIQAGQPENRNQ